MDMFNVKNLDSSLWKDITNWIKILFERGFEWILVMGKEFCFRIISGL